jgi:hypothetical protein
MASGLTVPCRQHMVRSTIGVQHVYVEECTQSALTHMLGVGYGVGPDRALQAAYGEAILSTYAVDVQMWVLIDALGARSRTCWEWVMSRALTARCRQHTVRRCRLLVCKMCGLRIALKTR